MTIEGDLPDDVGKILEYLAMTATAHGNRLQPAEVDKLISDMAQRPHRWAIPRLAAGAVRARCAELGMTGDDTDRIVDLVVKVQTGEPLGPTVANDGFLFRFPIT